MTGAVVVGVIGHVDHGKTTLVRLLTGTDTDRLAEEKRRGISIALGFAHLAAPDGGVVDLVDMPGHERFVRTMISGATGITAALLVVAADEGVRPQTVEHVEIAALLGIRHAVLAVTRADLADGERASASERDASALLGSNGIARHSAHRVSAVTGDGVPSVAAALGRLATLSLPEERPDDGWAFLPVDRAFSLAGAGTVVTGTLRRGTIREGDELEALVPGAPGGPFRVRVRAVHTRGVRVAASRPWVRTALNLRAIEPGRVPRGTVLATAGMLEPSRRITVALRAAASAPALADGTALVMLAGTDEVPARLRLLDRDALKPGEVAPAQLVAARPVAVPAREAVVLRVASPAATVAGGPVLETGERRLKRHHPATLERLAARQGASAGAIVLDALSRADDAGTTLAALGRAAGVAPSRAAALLDGSRAKIARRGGGVMSRAGWERLLRRLPTLVAAGVPPDPARILGEEAVAALVEAGVLGRDGGRLFVRDARRDAARKRSDDEAARVMLREVRAGGLTPRPLAEIAPDPPARRLLDRLARAGAVVLAADRVQKRDWAFATDHVEAARAALSRALAERPGGMLVGEVGMVLGLTRRHAVPLLEHLDASGFTRRVGDRRILAAQARRGPAD